MNTKKESKKQLDLERIDLAPGEMHRIYGIMGSIFHFASHDLNNRIYTIRTWSLLLEDMAFKEEQDINEILQVTKAISEKTERLGQLLRIFFPSWDLSDVLVSRPIDIVKAVPDLDGYGSSFRVQVTEDSPASIELLYPENILAAIFIEIIANARSATGVTSVTILWKCSSFRFHFEVHDNGPGILPNISDKQLSPKEVIQKSRGGLDLVNRVVQASRGFMSFKRSNILGGTAVLVDLPVTVYFAEGQTYVSK